jgi:hypothetical protein
MNMELNTELDMELNMEFLTKPRGYMYNRCCGAFELSNQCWEGYKSACVANGEEPKFTKDKFDSFKNTNEFRTDPTIISVIRDLGFYECSMAGSSSIAIQEFPEVLIRHAEHVDINLGQEGVILTYDQLAKDFIKLDLNAEGVMETVRRYQWVCKEITNYLHAQTDVSEFFVDEPTP